MKIIEFRKKIPYLRYLEMQEKLRKFRKECILFLEHAPTITGGINYNPENLLVKPEFLESMGIQIHWTQRGGDFTAHEPGQLVLYSHVDLKKRNLSIRFYLENLLRSVIDSVRSTWDLQLISDSDSPGLYLESNPSQKICSIGVNFKSFFTSHGIAFNLSNDLKTFRCINPCGRNWTNMTSVKDLGFDFGLHKRDELISCLKKNLCSFLEPINVSSS
ncbi:biotin/lipoate protein ligase [Leptospira interrogans serovar Lai str. IPAV]|uniref:Octanoyltransferase n=2 Tax=Leptospira interrogans TaxID=173 RepID=LIPB_LEPIN|nr:RecName: Full=Octanoyltransferase; AltName: Full=Lipoate-protein ligase B; AltName: Full=Lipoyl/octanoyl transferase; AltName: Full=Octanoyl-[acyl-carrier-protein]-protein N-octanoyltransferase [Leptospira interrogans serovar Lai str. 56601]AAN48930.1 biotin/lipoate protein ligase [Leptospira interrogans serovar Lai str. 56601]AER02200.1 biotin/lipoate protein ligase [Leptospira interrogans serovar Lai str. IPAV]